MILFRFERDWTAVTLSPENEQHVGGWVDFEILIPGEIFN